jgi:predicted O-methyltransferase YrrM
MGGENHQAMQFSERDYVSPGLKQIQPDRCFPNLLIGNPLDCFWPFLRREIPHNWYVDARYPMVGFINRDEAHILYNSALMFQGKQALEVGCWLGWSACHIALAGLEVDVIDPILENPEFFESVRDSLEQAGVLSSVRLIPGSSPDRVEELAKQEQRRWSFMFIDGNHEAPHPLNDVKLCEQFAEADALVLFHDLVSPGVGEALDYMRSKGWNVVIYHTAQIMGAAWRGNVEPVRHQPDPTICWQTPSHLRSYCGNSGEQPDIDESLRTTLDRLQGEIDWLRVQLKFSQDSFWQVHEEKAWVEAELKETSEKLFQAQIELSQLLPIEAVQPPADQIVQVLQTDLHQAQIQVEKLKANVGKKRDRLRFRIEDLKRKKAELAQAYDRIAAMESSKFWRLRSMWMIAKRRIGWGDRG